MVVWAGPATCQQPKLANVLFTYELARRLQGTSVTANVLHPGVVCTSFGAEDPSGVQRLFIPFMRPFMRTPARGAATSIYLASAPDLEQLTGRFFVRSQPKRHNPASPGPAHIAPDGRSLMMCRSHQTALLSGQPRLPRPDAAG